jgi:hypothetical protein
MVRAGQVICEEEFTLLRGQEKVLTAWAQRS